MQYENLQKRITLYFDNALNDTDKQDLLNQVNDDPQSHKLFEKEQHLRSIIKARIKRPSATPDLIQSIKDKIRIS